MLSGVCLYLIELLLFIMSAYAAMHMWQPALAFKHFKLLCFASALFLGPYYWYKGLYSFPNWLFWDELKTITRISLTMLVVAMAMKVFIAHPVRMRTIATLFVLFNFADYGLRGGYRFIPCVRRAISRKILIIGSEHRIKQLQRRFSKHRFLAYEPLGYLSKEAHPGISYDYLGEAKDLKKILKELAANGHQIEEIIVASEEDADLQFIQHIDLDNVPCIKFTPPTYMMMNYSSSTQDLEGLILVNNSFIASNGSILFFKRIMDLSIGLLALIIIVPVCLICAVCIKLDSPGPIFFKQERIGLKGKYFKILKFRSMSLDAESKLQRILEEDEEAREEYAFYKKLSRDPRITKIGRILRRYSLDELPQIINVLKGDMSLVGPRPYLPSEKNEMKPHYRTIVRVKPGITGMWQVSGRSDIKFKSRLLLDVYYVHNYAISLDIQILFRTIQALVSRRGSK